LHKSKRRKIEGKDVDWIQLAVDGHQCEHSYEPLASVNAGNFLTTEQILDSEEGLCSIYLVGFNIFRFNCFVLHTG
jgi:hypothetical protein